VATLSLGPGMVFDAWASSHLIYRNEPLMTIASIRMVILDGPDAGRLESLGFEKSEIRIGRTSPNDDQAQPDVALDSDFSVSRHHARLVRIKNKWHIVDLQSKSGTLVNGREIKGRGAIVLTPGEIVVTGETTWTVIPEDWIHVHDSPILVAGPYVGVVNYSTYHSGVPILGGVLAVNYGRRASPASHLRLVVEGFSDPCEIEVPSLAPGQKMHLAAPPISLRSDILRRQAEQVHTRFRLEIVGQPPVSAVRDIRVLGFWDWPYEQTTRKTLAAFVSPRNPVVEHIILEAQAVSKETTGFESFRDLIRSGCQGAEKLILQSVYGYLRENTDIHFEDPKVVSDPTHSRIYQTVKPPHHVFTQHLSSKRGKAKCLDLVILSSACLENVGLFPVVILTGAADQVPKHALLGCWTTPTPYGIPLLPLDTMRDEIRSANLLIVECLGVVPDANPAKTKMSFSQAVKAALRILDRALWAQGIDVASVRPPYGSVLPMDNPLEPEVESAFEKARSFAARKGLSTVETTHLFYGLIVTKSSLARYLLRKAGLNPEAACRQLCELFEAGHASQPPVYTDNLLQCKRSAEEYASQAGSPSIQEYHLLWALFDRAQIQGSFHGNCRRLKIDLERLRILLSERHPPPRGHGFGSVPVDRS